MEVDRTCTQKEIRQPLPGGINIGTGREEHGHWKGSDKWVAQNNLVENRRKRERQGLRWKTWTEAKRMAKDRTN